ncbi:MAG: iron-containing alcohol dehydrogenase [Leptospirales bacterium]
MQRQTNWFDYFAPTKIVYEAGSAGKIGDIVKKYGSRFLIINIRKDNENPNGLDAIADAVTARTSGCVIHNDLIGDPDTEQIDSATFFARRSHADCIIAYGGIDTINTAKAVALLSNNSFFAADLFNKKPEIVNPPKPLIIVPTEPALGEELTGYFTLIDAETNIRRIYTNELIFPQACIYDVTLSSYIKSDSAARIGGAILAVAIERFFSPGTNPVIETLLTHVFQLLHESILPFYKDPSDQRGLKNIYWSSTMTGLSLVNVPNGLNWALALVLSNKTQLNFHHALSLMLPYVMEYYLTTVSEKYVAISRAFKRDIGDSSVIEAAIQAIEHIRNLFSSLNLPTRLSEFYINQQQIPEIAKEVATFPQLANSPKKLRQDEIESILLTAM